MLVVLRIRMVILCGRRMGRIPLRMMGSVRAGVGIKTSDETVDDAKPVKTKTRAQQIKEDLDVGGFYADKRDWKGALGRYESAFKLDAENEDAIFGLAETERHMNELGKAKEHYELFLFL